MKTKSFWKSKVLWFNALTVIITLASFFGFSPNQELADTVAKTLLGLSPLVNLLLRFVTTRPIGL